MNDSAQLPMLQKPSAAAAIFNRVFGFLVGLGIGPRYMRLLQVRGRKTGRVYSTPVNLLEVRGNPTWSRPAAGRNGCAIAKQLEKLCSNGEACSASTACGQPLTPRSRTSSNYIWTATNPRCSGFSPCLPARRQPLSAIFRPTIPYLNWFLPD